MLTNCGTYVVATIWPQRCTWWLKPSSGFTRWSGGWERGCVEERELACDEAVLEFGSERQVYAESILKVCEFCVGSPLACVSGVTGADLKKRGVHIMSETCRTQTGSHAGSWCSSAAGLVALAVPVLFGLLNSTQSRAQSLAGNTAMAAPGYVSASIKPNQSDKNMVRLLFTPDGFSATGVTLQTLIREAYGVEDNQISGAPDWVNTQRYDIEAKRDKSVANELRALGPDQGKLVMQGMLQSLLADRFKLTLHLANKDLQQYSLVVAENGPKLQQSKPEDTYPNEIRGT